MNSSTKLGLGVALMIVSTIVLAAFSFPNTTLPTPLGGVASIALATGVILVGLSEPDASI